MEHKDGRRLFLGEAPSANLDFLRSVAVLLVLAQHLSRRLHVFYLAWIPTSCLGLFGVLLFFVHTCLVLMHSMQRSGLTGMPLLKNFYTRRFFRIYPLAVLIVLAALAFHLDSDINGIPGLSQGAFPGKTVLISNLLLVQNLFLSQSVVNVLWSLPFELQMYIFLPFLFFWVRRGRAFWALIGLWVFSVFAALLQVQIHGLERLSFLHFVPNFLPGVLAFALPRTSRIRSSFWPIFVLSLVTVFTFCPTPAAGWLLCLILGLCIPQFTDIATPWLCRISHEIATYSYGIYLGHQFCIWFALGVLARHSAWLRIPVLLLLLLTTPVLLYHAVERPMIRVGVRLANRLSTVRTKRDAGPTPIPVLRFENHPEPAVQATNMRNLSVPDASQLSDL